MTHPTFASLHVTLDELRRRRSTFFILRQLSLFCAASALLIFGFAMLFSSLQPGPVVSLLLLAVLSAGIGLLCWRLIGVLRSRHATFQRLAHYVEDHIPDLEQRLLTSLEFTEDELRFGRRGVSQQFIAQLWQDAERHMVRQQEEMEAITPVGRSRVGLASGFAAVLAVSVVLFTSDSLKDSLGNLLWPFEDAEIIVVGEPPPNIEISLEPGDVQLQRGDGLTVAARVTGAAPEALTLRLQDDNVNWRDMPMRQDGRGSDSASFSYFIPSLREDTVYYVTFNQAGSQGSARNSQQFRISVYDLPRVEQIDVAFDYPEYTGMEDFVDEDGGDLIAPVGTEVEVSVTFNKAIAEARLEFAQAFEESAGEDAAGEIEAMPDLPLAIDGSVGTASFTIGQDGVYRVQATDNSDLSSLDPLDYYIRAIADQPPELALRRPGRDQDVMPLEEVILEIDASDDYGLTRFDLNYSVVGQDEVVVDFLPDERVRDVSGEQLIYLEDLEVEPGDFVSYYLTLADNNGLAGPSEIISDIYFLQVIPTDQEFRRGQGGGGGGGGGGGQGGDSSALVTIQKDIIAATWKLKNRQNQASREDFAADAEIISESQKEATGRARMSIDRLSERLNFSDDSYDQAVQNLSLAIEQMNLAAQELDLLQVTSALQPEQAALQYILRAEASINRTEISMQQGGGGGGGSAARQEREDLRELFEMELGQLENRYENPNSRGQSAQQQEEANKLEELARRQEGLTRAQRNLARRADQLTEEQKRRELERLMRQQEQLSQEVQQLAQQMSRGQQSSSSAQGQNSQNPSGSPETSPQSSPETSALRQAAQQMQEAAESDSPSIAAARSQKALENLRRQQQQLGEQADRSVNQLARNLGQRGQQLLDQQRELREAIEEAGREMGLGQTRQSVRNDEDLQELIEGQQRQQQDLEEIEDMLRAVVARGSNEDQRLLSQAQEATRELRPIQEEMQTSNRILRNGMVNLAVDIEQTIEEQLEGLARSLAALDPERAGGNPLQQAARNAEELRERLEDLERQILALNENGNEPGTGMPSVGELREQLQRSRQLAQQINQQMQQQAQQGGNAPGGSRQAGQRQLGADRYGPGGEIRTDGGNLPWGDARSVTQQITRQDIEDFLNQPELFRALLQPVIELEGALRAQAELEQINERLYATIEEDIPDEYRDLVQEYYRVLSEQQGTDDPSR
ncbi:MAG: hypothetical protein F4Y89_14120 [Gammaproteobacteria bacterium]|nr:hypothetical protein [Gammaproteobacteria bacterium]MYG97461.1 hypothetical protein [Gammaproteobacteria bacterium]